MSAISDTRTHHLKMNSSQIIGLYRPILFLLYFVEAVSTITNQALLCRNVSKMVTQIWKVSFLLLYTMQHQSGPMEHVVSLLPCGGQILSGISHIGLWVAQQCFPHHSIRVAARPPEISARHPVIVSIAPDYSRSNLRSLFLKSTSLFFY